jgi:hypothetical protein
MDPMDTKDVLQAAEVMAGSSQAGGLTEGALALATVASSELEPEVTREQRRSRRKRDVRARTISVKRMTKRELELGRMI